MRLLTALAALLVLAPGLDACTNVIVTKGASRTGATLLAYTDDSVTRYGDLAFRPRQKHLPGTMRDVIDWSTGVFHGRIPEAALTYQRIGNMNEHQLCIAETTFTGRKESEGSGMMDYGSLMYIALERAKTAREAITVITGLVEQFGYNSTGESISICDPNEAWILEIIGKGKEDKGAVWVAVKLADGTMSAHANQARIRQFPLNDPANATYSKDVITFAKTKGWFRGEDKDFRFADAYAPLEFSGLRACEARVWSVFRRSAPSQSYSVAYAMGDATAAPLPYAIRPDKKLDARDVMELLRDHYEGTEMDPTKDVGAGPFGFPLRWRPNTWKLGETSYINERPISTMQTAWSFVAEMRAGMPDAIGGCFWFGVDDSYLTCYVPFYMGMTDVPPSWREKPGGWDEFTWDSAFWSFTFVSNYTYGRWSDMVQDVQKVQRELEGRFLAEQPDIEAHALALHKQDPMAARQFLTKHCIDNAEMVVKRWQKLGQKLIWKYNDGNVRDVQGKVSAPGYSEAWRKRMAGDRGDAIKVKPVGEAK